MAKTLKSEQIVSFTYYNEATQAVEDIQIVLVDVTPHLMHYLLLKMIPKHRERAQLAFKVSFGVMNAFV